MTPLIRGVCYGLAIEAVASLILVAAWFYLRSL